MDFASGEAALQPPPEGGPGPGFDVPAPSGPGSALPDGLRGSMEGSFGADFSGVRVHRGPSAEAMGGVRAATQGSDITFASGEYAPESRGGRELIGHELTHVVQQAAGRVEPTTQAKGGDGEANTDPGLEAEADHAGALAAAGRPAPVAGESAPGGGSPPGQVTQFKNPLTRLRDKFDPTKKAERKVKRADNRTEIDTARDDPNGAAKIAATAAEALKAELATFVQGQLGGDADLVKTLQDKGRETAINKMGAHSTTVKRSDAAEYVALEARTKALGTKAQELADAKLTTAVTDAVLEAAKKGYDETSGSGDVTGLIVDAEKKATKRASAAATAQAPAAKKQLGKELVQDKAAIGADLEAKTAAEVRTKDAKRELKERRQADPEVQAALTGVFDLPLQHIDDKVLAFLESKLGVEGAGLMRSAKLKIFRNKMKAAARDQAKEDVETEAGAGTATAESDELMEDATKRSGAAAKGSMKTALKKLAKDGLKEAKTQEKPKLVLELAASKAAWGAIRANDGRDGKAEAEAAVKVALPEAQQKVLDAARSWRDAIVKTQANIDVAETRVRDRVTKDKVGEDAVNASKGVKGDVEAVVLALVPPAEQEVETQIYKHLKVAIGAMGAGWWRGDAVKQFRGNMKKAGRKQAYADVDAELATPTLQETQGAGKATKAYMSVAGKDVAYDKSKGSVNEQMKEFAKSGAADALVQAKTHEALGKIARQGAFKGFRQPGEVDPKQAANDAAQLALNGAFAAQVTAALAKADAWKAQLFATEKIDETDNTGITTSVDTKEKVKKKVEDDHVGTNSVKQAIKANTTAEGMAATGRIADLAAPNRGDAAKLEVEMRIPVPNSPAFIKLHVVAEAERGVTTRKNGAPTGGVDAKSLKVGAQFNVGGGVDLWGLRLDGTIGFFVRAQAMDTQKTFQALNYGAYRSACQINDGMADWWGGSGKSKSKDTATTATVDSDGGHKKSATERAELWAAMVEENVFMRPNPKYKAPPTGGAPDTRTAKEKKEFIPDDDAFVDIGGSLNAKAKLKAQVFEGEASARGELFAHYDAAVIKQAMKKWKRAHGYGPGSTSASPIDFAKAGTNETDAKERRKAIKPKTGGGLTIETKLGCTIADQAAELAVKGEIGTSGWGVEVAFGLKFDNASPTDFSEISNGIVGAGASGLRTLIGIYQNTQQTGGEQANKGIGSLLDAGSDAENIIDTATGGMLTTALGQAYQVSAAQSDNANTTVSRAFDDITGQYHEQSADEVEKSGAGSEVMLQIVMQFGPGTFNFQLKEIKVRKLAVDVGSAALEVSLEKQKRLAQIGMVDGKFHAEGLGFGTTKKNT